MNAAPSRMWRTRLFACGRQFSLTQVKPGFILRRMSGEPDVKKPRNMKKIGTHNGTFHCDDALACFMLRQLPEYKDAEIIRSRDPALWDTCDVLVDVGGVFDHEKCRYDHHQRTFNESMNSLNPDKKWVSKLSSAGLVYFHYGRRIISQAISKPETDDITEAIFDKVYENFLEEVDAKDNGIDQTEEKPRYIVSTTLSARVSHLNPRWNEPSTDDDLMVRFYKAIDLVGTELMERIDFYNACWLPARKLVQAAVAKRHEVDSGGEIINFGQGGCPWKDHLLTMEEEQKIVPTIKFVLFTDPQGKWRVQCVPVSLGSFENRISLLEAWCGHRGEELTKISGIPGCVFVHAGGFIGGNETYEGALEMAKRTLQGKPHPDS